jgi:hypothetical protein
MSNLSIGLKVSQKIQKALSGLHRKSNFVTRGLVGLGDGVSSNTTSVLGEWNSSLLDQDVLEIGLSLGESQALDGSANLTAMLVVNSEMTHTSFNS